ncbi:hypothetical protein [Pedobacter sp.]|uniref:hypothetical protein n=1 Tax=Pedobacter sp. TaxID=1411316 RepID=UPI0031DB3019
MYLFAFVILITFSRKINDMVRDFRRKDMGKLKADGFFLMLMIITVLLVYLALSKFNPDS